MIVQSKFRVTKSDPEIPFRTSDIGFVGFMLRKSGKYFIISFETRFANQYRATFWSELLVTQNATHGWKTEKADEIASPLYLIRRRTTNNGHTPHVSVCFREQWQCSGAMTKRSETLTRYFLPTERPSD